MKTLQRRAMARRAAAVLALACAALSGHVAVRASEAVASRASEPAIERARGERCIADPAFMRRNHMDLLRHQRDETVHEGMRGQRFSLKGCIDCHASRTTMSVAQASGDFCVACHSYAAVKIDCFECHSSQPRAPALGGPK